MRCIARHFWRIILHKESPVVFASFQARLQWSMKIRHGHTAMIPLGIFSNKLSKGNIEADDVWPNSLQNWALLSNYLSDFSLSRFSFIFCSFFFWKHKKLLLYKRFGGSLSKIIDLTTYKSQSRRALIYFLEWGASASFKYKVS